MIHKILKLKNIQRFKDYVSTSDDKTNLNFKRLTLIYGSNGSGKSTLTNIFSWMKTDEYVNIAASIQTIDKLEVEIMISPRLVVKLIEDGEDSKWTKTLPEIEIFDYNFIQRNIIPIEEAYSTALYPHFERKITKAYCSMTVWCTKEGQSNHEEIHRLVLEQRRALLRRIYFIQGRSHEDLTDDDIDDAKNILKQAENGFPDYVGPIQKLGEDNKFYLQVKAEAVLKQAISKLGRGYWEKHKKIMDLCRLQENDCNTYLEHCRAVLNKFLNEFDTGIKFTQLIREPVPDSNVRVELRDSDTPARYTAKHAAVTYSFVNLTGPIPVQFTTRLNERDAELLGFSESQQRAIAMSVFLTDLEIENRYREKILIFDDPVTSYDIDRKFITVAQLEKLLTVNEVKQLIVLSHDKDFLHEVEIKAETSKIPTATLEIQKSTDDDITSNIIARTRVVGYDEQRQYLEKYNGATTTEVKRLVLLYSRLVVESKIKTKFSNLLEPNGKHTISGNKKRKLQYDEQQLQDRQRYTQNPHLPPPFQTCGAIINLLKRRKDVSFTDSNKVSVIDDLEKVNNSTKKHLHGTKIEIPGSLTSDDLSGWDKTKLEGLINLVLNLINNRI